MIVVTALLTWRYIPESPVKTPAEINYRAAGLMTRRHLGDAAGDHRDQHLGLGLAEDARACSRVGLLVIGAWVREELRSREPLVDMRMMAIRGVWTTNTVAFLIGVGMYSSFILLPEFVQEPASTGYGFGASVTAAGLFLLPATIAITVVGQMAGVLERRIGSRGSLIGGAVFALAAYALLVLDRSAEVGDLRRRRPARHRDRPLVLGDGEPDRRERAPGADRRRDRDERGHADARRRLRRAARRHAARRQPRAPAASRPTTASRSRS